MMLHMSCALVYKVVCFIGSYTFTQKEKWNNKIKKNKKNGKKK